MTTAQVETQATAKVLEEKIRTRRARVGIIGLGYVGLPLAVEFARPMVPLSAIGAEDRLVPVVISPPVAASGRWLGTSLWALSHDRRLLPPATVPPVRPR